MFLIPKSRILSRKTAAAEQPATSVELDEELRDRIVFPILDDPPEYKRHRAASVPSYTSLRRLSLDSVFGSPSMLEMTPSYADIISQDELGYDTVRRHSLVDRRSFGDISSSGDGDQSATPSNRPSFSGPSAGQQRRNSFSALPLPWRRRSCMSWGVALHAVCASCLLFLRSFRFGAAVVLPLGCRVVWSLPEVGCGRLLLLKTACVLYQSRPMP